MRRRERVFMDNEHNLVKAEANQVSASAQENQTAFVELTNDLLFHMVFTKNEKALKGLLSSLLDIPEAEILTVDVLNPMQYNESIDTKQTILDLKLHLNSNRYVLVEMQVREFDYWTNRILIYGCRQINDQTSKKYAYRDLQPVVQISIMKYPLFTKHKRFYTEYKIQDKEGQALTDMLSFRVLDLSSIPDDQSTEKEQNKGLVDWANAFTAPDWVTLQQIDNPSVKEAGKTMELIMKNPTERQLIWDHQMALWDYESQLDSAERRGEARGQAKGQAKGEDITNRRNAKGMKDANIDSSIIASITGLSLEEIEELS